MTAILCLSIHGWIPVCIVEENHIGASEIQTDTTTSSWRNETENPWVSIEALNSFLPILDLRWAIQTDIREIKEI